MLCLFMRDYPYIKHVLSLHQYVSYHYTRTVLYYLCFIFSYFFFQILNVFIDKYFINPQNLNYHTIHNHS